MSSVFQKPLPDSSRDKFLLILVPVFFFLLPDVSGYRLGLLPPDDATEFVFVVESDYDELLVRLSLYAFTKLSPGDQLEQVEIIHDFVKSEDVELQGAEENDEAFRLRTFAELFKKLPYSDQLKLFLSKVIQKFKRERMYGELIVLFEHLDAKHQQRLIEKIVPVTPENILQKPGETEEDFRRRRFTQLSKDYTDYVYKRELDFLKDTMKSEDKMEKIYYDENNSDWMSSFTDFFSGFFIIWFQGQSLWGQDLLIEQLLLDQQVCGVIENPPHNDTEKGFRICKSVFDFKVQDKLLYHAEYKLEQWGISSTARLICEPPQESDRGAELQLLHSRLSTFGFSLLSSQNQQTKIDEMSNQVDRVVIERYAAAPALPPAAEDIRIRRFTELLDQVPPTTTKTVSDNAYHVSLKLVV